MAEVRRCIRKKSRRGLRPCFPVETIKSVAAHISSSMHESSSSALKLALAGHWAESRPISSGRPSVSASFIRVLRNASGLYGMMGTSILDSYICLIMESTVIPSTDESGESSYNAVGMGRVTAVSAKADEL